MYGDSDVGSVQWFDRKIKGPLGNYHDNDACAKENLEGQIIPYTYSTNNAIVKDITTKVLLSQAWFPDIAIRQRISSDGVALHSLLAGEIKRATCG